MLIGYARVSTDDQNLGLQKDALQQASCGRIFEDRMSGAKAERPGLSDALSHARAGDTLVVWRLDRSLKDLIEMVNRLESMDVGLRSFHESIDTSSSAGRLVFHVFGTLAEFERNLIRERTRAGLQAAWPGDAGAADPQCWIRTSGIWPSSYTTKSGILFARSAR